MIPLLPYEKYLASQIGVSEEQYQEFKAIMLRRSVERPAAYPRAGFVAPLIVPFLVNLAIGIGVSLLSSLLFPQRENNTRIKAKQDNERNLVSNQKASPRFGFDSIQEPASVGQLIPVVIAKRRGEYGGVRVNMPMVWSQLWSLRGSQMFRGIFLAGIANMAEDAWNPKGWAFGNNALGAYQYNPDIMGDAAKYTIYYNRGGGRIASASYLEGRDADKDIGNAENDGGQDVYALLLRDENYETAFCMTERPSTSTALGLYGWCPNGMLYRQATTIRPTIIARVNSGGNIRAEDDTSALVDFWKAKWRWSSRSGLREYKEAGTETWVKPAGAEYGYENQDVNRGDMLRYRISRSTDANTKIEFDDTNSFIKDNRAKTKQDCSDVGAGVAGWQSSADNFLIPGELYLIGGAWAVLKRREAITDESNESLVFISNQDQTPVGDGNTMEYTFVVVRGGKVTFVGDKVINPEETGTTIKPAWYNEGRNSDELPDPPDVMAEMPNPSEGRYRVASKAGQIFRLAIASVSPVREFQIVEIGFRSRVGIAISGAINYRAAPTLEEINDSAGLNQLNDSDNTISTSIYRSGTVTTRQHRFSTFRMHYKAFNDDDWTVFPTVIAVRGNTSEDLYNYIRIKFPTSDRWQLRFVPISSYELRRDLRGALDNALLVIDSTGNKEITTEEDGVRIISTGFRFNPETGKRRFMRTLDPETDIGIGFSDIEDDDLPGDKEPSMTDTWARFAEAFCFNEIETTVGTQPEHEIVYVNFPGQLDKTPSYECLATVGVNIIASLEFSSLQQFSGYCENGYEMRQLLEGDDVGSTNLFPDWLRELMTSTEVGPSPPIPDIQIDRDSFEEAAQWCLDRNYFYDAVEVEPLNILEWASDIAQAHLLKFVRIGGIYHLRKAIEFENPLPIAGLFTNGNIVEESFRLETVDYQTRQPFIVEVKWREENADSANPLFARERVATVAEVGTGATAPVETLDLSAWCTNYRQAIDAACYLIRFRRLADHRISFQTTPDVIGAQLASGSIIKVAIDVTNYDRAMQGYITASGEIVSTRPDLVATLDGEYSALLWDGVNEAVDGVLTVAEGAASPAGRFFAIAAAETLTRTYEISKLSFSADGIITVEAFHHPVDEKWGLSALGVNWTTYETDENWVITL